MKKYRQWLADTNQMTESPDGTHYLVSDVEKMEAEKDRVIQESCVIIAEGIKVVDNLEQQIAALEAVVKFNKYELAEKQKYILELEASVHEWQDIAGQWEDKCQKLTEQIAALQGEISRLYTITVEQSKQIAALTAELTEQKKTYRCFNCGFATSDEIAAEAHFGDSEGDISICVEWHNFSEDERLKVYQEITEELTRERNENVALTAENKQLRERLHSHGDIQTDEEEEAP